MVAAQNGDPAHPEESAQRPFVPTSDSLANIAMAQGIRLQDEQMAKQMHERWKSNWEDVDDALEGVGQASASPASTSGDRGSSKWWLIPGSSSPSSASSSSSQSGKTVTSPNDIRFRGDRRLKSLKIEKILGSQDQYDAPPTFAQQIQAALTPGSEQRDLDLSLNNIAQPSLSNNIINNPPPVYDRPDGNDDTLALLLPLLVLLSTLLFLLLIFIVLVIFVRRRARIALTEGDGPLDVGREEELEGLGGLDGVEERWLETVDDATRRGYARAKDYTLSFPPGSQSTDITLSQFLTIQEKGVSAWSFDPDYESNPSVFVEARTEITFIADGEGMAPQEGGGCCVQSNLPLPKLNEVYYWEAKMFQKPDTTNVAIGLASKPYPSFRLPGWSKFSVGFFSADGFKAHNYPFTSQSYGPAYLQGDVIGVGYRPRSGTVFFTRNGKKLDDAFIGLNRHNLFPTVGADGAAEIHINLGQAGFVFIEANVKKWGLAPMVGTLAPPPAYGMERGSILIETGQGTSNDQEADRRAANRPLSHDLTPPPPPSPPSDRTIVYPAHSTPTSSLSNRRRAKRSARVGAPSADPQVSSSSPPSPTYPRRLALGEEAGGSSGNSSSSSQQHRRNRRSAPSTRSDSVSSADAPHNPPTPNHLDISLHSLDVSHPNANVGSTSGSPSTATRRSEVGGGRGGVASYFPQVLTSARENRTRSPSPPPYLDQRHSWATTSGLLGGTDAAGNQPRRASGRSHTLANALFGALAERGLLTPLSSSGTPSDESQGHPGRGPILPRHDSVLDYERLQQASNNAQANSRNSNANAGWFSTWFRT